MTPQEIRLFRDLAEAYRTLREAYHRDMHREAPAATDLQRRVNMALAKAESGSGWAGEEMDENKVALIAAGLHRLAIMAEVDGELFTAGTFLQSVSLIHLVAGADDLAQRAAEEAEALLRRDRKREAASGKGLNPDDTDEIVGYGTGQVVWILHLTHQGDDLYYAFDSEAALVECHGYWVRMWWDESGPCNDDGERMPLPETKAEAIFDYYPAANGATYATEEAEINAY